MLNRYARAFFTRVLTPTARFLLRIGVGPDTVTLLGTLGVVACAVAFFPRGSFLVGTLAVTAFIFSDLLDGTMARLSGRASKWGGFLDATLDRFGDAAIFGSLAYYFAVNDKLGLFLACMICLISGSVTSYARAKAESLGFKCDIGYVERGERLVGSLVATGLDGLGVPFVQAIALWALAAGSTCTVVQRMLYVRKQALALGLTGDAAAAAEPETEETP
ncbi:CDP-alcohol phosphatidyltransferase family protein [Actinospica durhamensis]|uniref:Phosphatidylinositol phosphate synthase n=1 Tax=Actinospica durhamensis TaxID=1508375 RepID=A0A941EVE0_9ACTN|nr:CDP-alcohol phosphatidyltransferase family protein [Actinospica durhamensis]MBR7839000.1 CDP-alcohol phosphatidyltransferase family protein [Actinospica durhamensis]